MERSEIPGFGGKRGAEEELRLKLRSSPMTCAENWLCPPVHDVFYSPLSTS
jgi:hypothetical protein